MALPDQAVRDMGEDDLDNHVVVRVADEIVVDLMTRACGIDHDQASGLIDRIEIDGVVIPFANARLLWRTEDTARDRDEVDRAFLARPLASRGETVAWAPLDDLAPGEGAAVSDRLLAARRGMRAVTAWIPSNRAPVGFLFPLAASRGL